MTWTMLLSGLWKTDGRPMERRRKGTWKADGTADGKRMESRWKADGKRMEQADGKLTEISMESRWNSRWETDGKPMDEPMESR